MAVLVLVLAALAVFAIAAAVIGREARRLDAVAPRVVYALDEAVDFVADRLSPDAAGLLTHDDVRDVLRWHMEHLRTKGLQPEGVTDRPQDPDLHVVVHEDDAVAYLIGRSEAAGRPLADELLVEVVDLHFAYLREIGAVGPPASEDGDLPR